MSQPLQAADAPPFQNIALSDVCIPDLRAPIYNIFTGCFGMLTSSVDGNGLHTHAPFNSPKASGGETSPRAPPLNPSQGDFPPIALDNSEESMHPRSRPFHSTKEWMKVFVVGHGRVPLGETALSGIPLSTSSYPSMRTPKELTNLSRGVSMRLNSVSAPNIRCGGSD